MGKVCSADNPQVTVLGRTDFGHLRSWSQGRLNHGVCRCPAVLVARNEKLIEWYSCTHIDQATDENKSCCQRQAKERKHFIPPSTQRHMRQQPNDRRHAHERPPERHTVDEAVHARNQSKHRSSCEQAIDEFHYGTTLATLHEFT